MSVGERKKEAWQSRASRRKQKRPINWRAICRSHLAHREGLFPEEVSQNASPSDGGMPERCMQLCTARLDSELRSDIVLGPAVSPSFRAARIFTSDEQTTYYT